MSQAELTTSRLRLVPLAQEHVELAVELDADPEVMRYLAQGASGCDTAVQAHRNRLDLARRAPGMGLWAGFTGERFVGWWLLRPRDPVPVDGEAELGYRLMRRFWHQGLASEGARELIRHAFDDLGFSRVFADTMAANTASRATMTSVGMRYVRSFRRERDPSRPGSELGDVEYAVTRDAWRRTPERVEFLSPDWLAAVRGIAEGLLADLDTAGVDFTISEELTDPPAGRARTAAGALGWFLRLHDSAVEVGDRPRTDADLRVVADYRVRHDLSRRVWAGDPDAIATSARLRAEATAAGRLRVEGDLAQAPDAVRRLVAGLHDPVAEITR